MKFTLKKPTAFARIALILALYLVIVQCGSNKLRGEDFLGQRAMMGSESEEEMSQGPQKKNPTDAGVGTSASGTMTPVVPSAQGVGAQVYGEQIRDLYIYTYERKKKRGLK